MKKTPSEEKWFNRWCIFNDKKKQLEKGFDRKDVKMRDVVYEQLLWMSRGKCFFFHLLIKL